MLRHERLGVTTWEIPGGHVEPGESLEQAAARETFEESGVTVRVGRLLATCIHEWPERRQRYVVCFFEAHAEADREPRAPSSEAGIIEAAWRNPLELLQVSAFLIPLIEQERVGWVDAPISFRTVHRRNSRGLWEPALIR